MVKRILRYVGDLGDQVLDLFALPDAFPNVLSPPLKKCILYGDELHTSSPKTGEIAFLRRVKSQEFLVVKEIIRVGRIIASNKRAFK